MTCHQNMSLQLAQFQTFFHNILKIFSPSCLKQWRNLMNHDNAKKDLIWKYTVDPSRPRGASSGAVPPPPSSIDADAAETSGATAADVDVPPPTTSDDLEIRRTLDHVLTV